MKRLATGLDRARMCRSRIAKEEAIGDALRGIAGDTDAAALAIAARIACGRVLPVGDGRALGVGWSLMLDVVRGATGWDDDVIAACARKTGELAEAFALLARRLEGVEQRPGIALSAIAELAEALAVTSARADKRALLDDAFARTSPIETKYLAKALGGGMRIGAQDGVVLGGIARAFGVPALEVRRASALVTDVGELAVMARDGHLASARLAIGKPVAFQLATPLETIAGAIDTAAYVIEAKIDGVRAQAHKNDAGEVAIFARGLDRITDAFPEIADAMRTIDGPVVLDGEIVARGPTGRPRPFQALQTRLRKMDPTEAELDEVRVTLFAFDLLADASGSLLDRAWTARRERLIAALDGFDPVAHPGMALAAIAVNPASPIPERGAPGRALDAAFDAARAGGHEGLVLKRADAPYEPGRRGQAWIKVKRAHGSLDVVVVAAQEGHGKRAGALSDYTFAVWRDDDLVPVGKAYSGLTDDEIERMTRRLEAITVERQGGVRRVRPEIVIEVAFDGVQKSGRNASGFALRFPRILRVRDDKNPAEADRLAAVEALFESQVAGGHREREVAGDRKARKAAGKAKPKRSKASVPTAQLALFDVPALPDGRKPTR